MIAHRCVCFGSDALVHFRYYARLSNTGVTRYEDCPALTLPSDVFLFEEQPNFSFPTNKIS